ncbi:MAG: alkaline phosphatase family protein, partial [Candidatus Omnitrophota bacterium]
IGLDGVPFSLLENLTSQGVMSHTGKVIAQGKFQKMDSSIPEVSSVAWSSIITGKNPGQHGIFGFTDLVPKTYRLRFPNYHDLQSQTFWMENNLRSILVNIPATYPVKEINGIHISGFVSLELEKAVHPKSLIPFLKEIDYRLDTDSALAHKSLDLFLEDLDKTLNAQIALYRHLWNSQTWGLFFLVFTGTDRLMHFLWKAYQDEQNQYHRDFLNHFRKIDGVIGEISANLNPDDLLLIISDHGFEDIRYHVNINLLLKEAGFLRARENPSQSPFCKGGRRGIRGEEGGGEEMCLPIGEGTRAFALDPARIYLNREGKYPQGAVSDPECETLLKKLIDIFSNLEKDGEKVIRSVYRKEEIYHGPFLEQAPDLILVGARGFNLKANFKADELYSRDIFTGKHSQDDAFLAVNYPEVAIPDNLNVCDIPGILMR